MDIENLSNIIDNNPNITNGEVKEYLKSTIVKMHTAFPNFDLSNLMDKLATLNFVQIPNFSQRNTAFNYKASENTIMVNSIETEKLNTPIFLTC
jgi:hypothetical protein